ncbi:IgGFc-binding protein-like isoform X1 [Poecile atricapillus]|uniref:IgGFc-binding protein-like isoform X1 n=1 Tax=Poecile atricapillus TaxID=48891 RepID=UPI00273817C9|nr:IgGFc-binding protein-like isoform X1 [Poecile atricapillus]
MSARSRELKSQGAGTAEDGIWWFLLPFFALSSASYRGQEFLAVFPQNDDESPSAYLQLLFTSYGPASTQVSLTLRGRSVTQNVTLRLDVTVPLPLPANLELPGSCTCHKTLAIQASADISYGGRQHQGLHHGCHRLPAYGEPGHQVNHRSRLPISLSHGKLCIHQKGKSMLIQLNFNLKVLYNWDDHVVIKLPAALSGKVCGMCGNSNGDPQDDVLSPDGKQGLFHGLGEEFWGDLTCTQRCVCDVVQQQAVCWDSGCGTEEECRVEEGIQECYPKIFGVCSAVGATHSKTFDGKRFILQGTCVYLLVGLCEDTQNLVGFQVLVQNGHQSDNLTSSIAVVTVKVYNKTISINRDHPGKIMKEVRQKGKVSGIQMLSVEVYGVTLTLKKGKGTDVMVDSIFHHLPTILSKGWVQVSIHGSGVLLRTDFSLVVHYDLIQHMMVMVPQTYMGRLCGLCGNYKGQHNDDFQLSSGQLAPDATAFGSAWKTTDTPCDDTCPKDECPTCTEEKEAVLQNPNYCGLLTAPEGPFGSCHGIIDPIPYSQSCIHDLCLTGGDRHFLCQSIQSYVTVCQDAGVTMAWFGGHHPSVMSLEGHWDKCPLFGVGKIFR